MTPSDLVNGLRDTYGDTLTTGDLRGYCAAQGISMGFARRKLDEFKVARGKWDLTVNEVKKQLEKTITSTTVIPPVERNLVPTRNDTFAPYEIPFTRVSTSLKIFLNLNICT